MRSPLLRLGLAAGAGVLLGAAFPPSPLWPVAWGAPALFLRTLRGAGPGAAAGAGAGFGAGLCLAGMGWLYGTTVPGALGLTAYFALYYAAAAPVLGLLLRVGPAWLPLAAAAGWVAQEYLLAHLFTGIPWLLLGYTQAPWSALVQTAALGGVYAVSGLCAWGNGILLLGRRAPGRIAAAHLAAFGLCLIGALAYGRSALAAPPPPPGPLVAVVQPGVPQRLKDNPLSAAELVERNHRLSLEAVKPFPPDLLVWAETMNPYPLGEGADSRYRATRRFYGRLVTRHYRTWWLLGSLYHREPPPRGRYWNSALLWDPRGRLRARYDKLHPIPWAEYVPGRIGFLEALLERYAGFPLRMLRGERPTVFRFGRGHWAFGALICYDVIHPGTARALVRRGARFLVNLANEAWFGTSREFDQLLAIARFRAVENRVPVVRATNSGISAVIDAWGRVRARILVGGRDRAVAGVLRRRVRPGPARSLYLRLGDWVAWAAVLGAAAAALAGWGRKRR